MSTDKKKQRMTRDIVPEDFTLSLALVDAIPVIFFGINFALLGQRFGNLLFILGAILCLFAGACKVLWKITVVCRRRNVWWLFLQMRILMPIGFLMMIAALIVNRASLSASAILAGLLSFPSVIFFALGFALMILMCVFAVKLNNSDLRANWIEQLTNGIAQISFFIGILLL